MVPPLILNVETRRPWDSAESGRASAPARKIHRSTQGLVEKSVSGETRTQFVHDGLVIFRMRETTATLRAGPGASGADVNEEQSWVSPSTLKVVSKMRRHWSR